MPPRHLQALGGKREHEQGDDAPAPTPTCRTAGTGRRRGYAGEPLAAGMGIDSNQFLSTYPVRNSYSLSLAPQEGTVETPTGRGRASNCIIGSTAPSSSPATSPSPCASEQQLSPSAKLPEDEVAVGCDNDWDDDDDDDDDDELIILPKDKSSKVSALGLERPGDG